MINLLPPAQIDAVYHEYRRRRRIVWGTLLLGVALVALVIMASLLLLFHTRRLALAENLAALEAERGTKEFDPPTIARARELGEKLAIIAGPDEDREMSGMIQAVLLARGPGVSLAEFRFENGGDSPSFLYVGGEAVTRRQFLAFVEGLKKEPLVAKVESPVSNLIRGAGVKFTITIEVAARAARSGS